MGNGCDVCAGAARTGSKDVQRMGHPPQMDADGDTWPPPSPSRTQRGDGVEQEGPRAVESEATEAERDAQNLHGHVPPVASGLTSADLDHVPCAADPREATRLEFDVSMDRSLGKMLGVDVGHLDGSVLLVKKVTGGLCQEWNDDHPDLAVRAGDRIVDVNGVHGNVLNMVEECAKHRVLTMRMQRDP